MLEIGNVEVKRGAILIEVANDTEASVEARGEVTWPALRKAKPGATRSTVARQVQVGLNAGPAKTATEGTTVILRLPLPKSVRRQLDRRSPRSGLRARIDVKGTNLVPYAGTHELTVRLPGRAKPQRPR